MPASDKENRALPRLVAGGSGHGGATRGHRRVPNSDADPMVRVSPAAAAQIAGEPEMCTTDLSAENKENHKRAPRCSEKRVPALGTISNVP